MASNHIHFVGFLCCVIHGSISHFWVTFATFSLQTVGSLDDGTCSAGFISSKILSPRKTFYPNLCFLADRGSPSFPEFTSELGPAAPLGMSVWNCPGRTRMFLVSCTNTLRMDVRFSHGVHLVSFQTSFYRPVLAHIFDDDRIDDH